MSKLFYLLVVVLIVSPFIIYQYTTNELPFSYKGMDYNQPFITVSDHQPVHELIKPIRSIKNPDKKCDRICKLAKYLYRKEMNRLNEWWYSWGQMAKAKREKLHGKKSNKR